MKNKKRMFFMAVLLTGALLISGCSGSDDESDSASSDAAASAEETDSKEEEEDSYVFISGDVTIAMNAEADEIVEALGEYKSYFESESCAFEGLDKEYTYSGFVLTTYPLDDVDYVNGVEIVDDTVETPEGITIGSSYEDVIAAYGESDSEDSCTYELGDSTLLIILEDGVVISVQYTAITE